MLLSSALDPTNVRIGNVTGFYEDGWCNRYLSFDISATRGVSVCEFNFWLVPQEGVESVRFMLSVGDARPFRFKVPLGAETRVQSACAIRPGESAKLVLACEHRFHAQGDQRELSFIITHFDLLEAPLA